MGTKMYARHPVILGIINNIVATAGAAFTEKDSSLRLFFFLVTVAITWAALSTFQDYIQTTGSTGRILAGAIFTVPNVYFDRLLFRKWSYGEVYLGPVEDSRVERKRQTRWEFGTEVVGSTRCAGTEKEVANVPHFSQEDPQHLPTRPAFILRHFCIAVGLYYLNEFVLDQQLRVNQALLSDAYIPILSRIRSVSFDEIATRVIVTYSFWAAQFSLLHVYWSLAAIVSVIFKPGELKLWRPLFGSISNAYTMRNFWSKFWHQIIRLSVTGPASFITHTLLRLPKGSIVARYSNILFAFFMSGLMHIAGDFGGGVSLTTSGAIHFFCIQTVGIMIEDGVQALYRGRFGNSQGLLCKVIGYVWVFVFLAWSSPVWVYPVSRTMKREDMRLLTIESLRPLTQNLF